jgi:CPA2 family monovalent cation:H+ antiporter-2
VGGGLVALLWRWFVKLHARLQIALLETFADEGEHD